MFEKKILSSYADAMSQAADIVARENVDYLVAPMMGSIPFIDAMTIVSNDFDPSKVVYMPASSRVIDVNNVIRQWYGNFLNYVVKAPHNFPKIMGIDEVVSGASVVRCVGNIDLATDKKRRELRQSLVERVHSKDVEKARSAINEADMLTENEFAVQFASIRNRLSDGSYIRNPHMVKQDSNFFVETVKNNLNKRLSYTTIGIEDSKLSAEKRSRTYEIFRSNGRVIPVSVKSIITMDNPDYCPVKFSELPGTDSKNYVHYGPKIDSFSITPEYILFLKSLANYVGKNSDQVSMINMSAIINSEKFLNVS